MLKPDVQKYTTRLKEIRDLSYTLISLERSSSPFAPPCINETDQIEAWVVSAKNIVERLFSKGSVQYQSFYQITSGQINYTSEVLRVKGVLDGIIDDIENGYIDNLVTEITVDILADVLEQAKAFLEENFKDAAAVYARVAIEKYLRVLADNNGVDSKPKASALNDQLKTKDVYPPVKWREIQLWLDIGNASAHGKFSEYTKNDVNTAIIGIEKFIKHGA